ncbi:hypothetical protein Lal_00039199 [Lupinus albus]|nr:hypothetical protein Lal_00039199 [Lupinus albus]
MEPVSAKGVRTSLKEGGSVFVLLASLEGIEKPNIDSIPIVHEFLEREISSREDISVLNSLTKALLLSPFYFLFRNSTNRNIEFLAIVIVPITYNAETSDVAYHRYITTNRTEGFEIQNYVISLNMGSDNIFPKFHVAIKYTNKLTVDIVRFAAKVEKFLLPQ